MPRFRKTTAAQAGLSIDVQIRLALKRIVERGGEAQLADLYDAIESFLNPLGMTLSVNGKATFRHHINRTAVQAGYLYPFDRFHPGWRITPDGREFLDAPSPGDDVAVNVDTGTEVQVPSNAVRGAAFEHWVLRLLTALYPYYTWYHQGVHRQNERGLDFIGTRLGEANGEPGTIGVQVKLHQPNNAPTEKEWLKFLSGCFARRVGSAIFITSGALSGAQRREAQESGVRVIEGRPEVDRIADLWHVARFDWEPPLTPSSAVGDDVGS